MTNLINIKRHKENCIYHYYPFYIKYDKNLIIWELGKGRGIQGTFTPKYNSL